MPDGKNFHSAWFRGVVSFGSSAGNRICHRSFNTRSLRIATSTSPTTSTSSPSPSPRPSLTYGTHTTCAAVRPVSPLVLLALPIFPSLLPLGLRVCHQNPTCFSCARAELAAFAASAAARSFRLARLGSTRSSYVPPAYLIDCFCAHDE